jgi:toxin-antitoxin system PIN domain toxin
VILFDVNVLIALGSRDHECKVAAEAYFCALTTPFATCPITQTGFVRVLAQINPTLALTDGVAVLASLCAHPKHQFIADDVNALDLPWKSICGHRQVTDAYLAALARRHGAKLATFDRALSAVHPDVAVLI